MIERQWGAYADHLRTDTCVFKTLYIFAGRSTSLQRHNHRSEVWFVSDGTVRVEIGDEVHYGGAGSSFTIPCGVWHRLTAVQTDVVMREMQFGTLCSEEDIERKPS